MRRDHAGPKARWWVVGGVLVAIGAAFAGPPPAQAATVDVTGVNRTFVPASITVPLTGNEPGFPAAHAHVVWTMADDATQHTVTFDDPRLVSSAALSAGQKHEVVIYTPATYPYRCTIHPGMAGTVVVTPEPATTAPPTTAPGPPASSASPARPPGAGPGSGGSGRAVVLGVGGAGVAVVAGLGWLLVRRRQAEAAAAGD